MAAERAHMIHSNMVALYKASGDEHIRPSTISYNAVLNAWSKSGCGEACCRAEGILEEMLEGYMDNDDVREYNGVYDVYDYGSDIDVDNNNENNNHGNTSSDQEMAGSTTARSSLVDDYTKEEKKEEARRISVANQRVVKPDVVSFTSVIGMWFDTSFFMTQHLFLILYVFSKQNKTYLPLL